VIPPPSDFPWGGVLLLKSVIRGAHVWYYEEDGGVETNYITAHERCGRGRGRLSTTPRHFAARPPWHHHTPREYQKLEKRSLALGECKPRYETCNQPRLHPQVWLCVRGPLRDVLARILLGPYPRPSLFVFLFSFYRYTRWRWWGGRNTSFRVEQCARVVVCPPFSPVPHSRGIHKLIMPMP